MRPDKLAGLLYNLCCARPFVRYGKAAPLLELASRKVLPEFRALKTDSLLRLLKFMSKMAGPEQNKSAFFLELEVPLRVVYEALKTVDSKRVVVACLRVVGNLARHGAFNQRLDSHPDEMLLVFRYVTGRDEEVLAQAMEVVSSAMAFCSSSHRHLLVMARNECLPAMLSACPADYRLFLEPTLAAVCHFLERAQEQDALIIAEHRALKDVLRYALTEASGVYRVMALNTLYWVAHAYCSSSAFEEAEQQLFLRELELEGELQAAALEQCPTVCKLALQILSFYQ